MSKFWKIAGIATLVAVVGVVALVAVAFAQGPLVKPPFPMRMLAQGPFGGGGHPPFGPFGGFEGAEEYREEMHAAVAEAMGKSVEELEAALADGQSLEQIAEAQGVDLADVWATMAPARQRLLQRAVGDELLTQRQADWIGERMAERGPGKFGRGRFAGHFGGGRGHLAGPFSGSEEMEAYREQMHAAVAEALGISVEEFDAALAEGQTPCQIAEAQGLDPAEVWAATESTCQELLQQAVEDELLTQQQADWIGERMAAFDADQWCAEGGYPGFFGGGHGHPAFDGPMGINPEQAQAYREQMFEAFAGALDMSVEELEAALADGQNPCQIIEDQGMEPAEVWAATESARQGMLQQAVEDGLLTQKQADWIGQRLAEHDPAEWCAGDGPGHGMWGMGKGFHGFPAGPGDAGE